MRRIRVLLARLPRLLRDILHEILMQQSDMEVVGELDDDGELLAQTYALSPDVLIMGLDGHGTSEVPHEVLRRAPQVKVLAIDANGRAMRLYEMRPHQVLLGEASPTRLLGAIRESTEREVG